MIYMSVLTSAICHHVCVCVCLSTGHFCNTITGTVWCYTVWLISAINATVRITNAVIYYTICWLSYIVLYVTAHSQSTMEWVCIVVICFVTTKIVRPLVGRQIKVGHPHVTSDDQHAHSFVLSSSACWMPSSSSTPSTSSVLLPLPATQQQIETVLNTQYSKIRWPSTHYSSGHGYAWLGLRPSWLGHKWTVNPSN